MNSNESKKNKKTFIFCLRKYNFEFLDLGIFWFLKLKNYGDSIFFLSVITNHSIQGDKINFIIFFLNAKKIKSKNKILFLKNQCIRVFLLFHVILLHDEDFWIN